MVRCDLVMANDVSGPVAFRQMEKMGAKRVFDPERVVMVADHFMPAKDAKSAMLQKRLKDWSDEQGVFYYGQGLGGWSIRSSSRQGRWSRRRPAAPASAATTA